MLPYPLLSASLVLMWLALNGFTLGHLILGCIVSVFASWGVAALRPAKPRLRKWYLLPRLLGIVLYDIVRSNIAVASILVTGGMGKRKSGFVTVPLVLLIAIAASLRSFAQVPVVRSAFAGIRVCVCVLIVNAVLRLWKNSVVDRPTLLLFAAVFALSAASAIMPFSVSPAVIVLASLLFGVVWQRRIRGKK